MYHEPLDLKPSRDDDWIGGAVLLGIFVIVALVMAW